MDRCQSCGGSRDGYDALMAELAEQRAYGRLTVDIRDGAVRLIELHRTAKTASGALKIIRGECAEPGE